MPDSPLTSALHEQAAAAVAQFHDAFEVPVRTEPTVPDGEEAALRIRLLDEEFEEYLAALDADNLVKVADGLTDMLYVAHGTGHSYGVVLPAAGYQVQGLSIGDAFETYLEAAHSTDPAAVANALSEVLAAIEAAAGRHDVPLSEVLVEVHASNMSKLGPDGRPIHRTDGKVLKGPDYFPPRIDRILARHRQELATS